ncbi:MAG: mechanosensitive ion channel family protein [Rugosibacter sp.]|nr:MAG: mechanosensitive ion channel family protein [Rugosibacter sp.]
MVSSELIDWNLYPWLETGFSAAVALLVMELVYRFGWVFIKRVTGQHTLVGVALRQVRRPFEFFLLLFGLQIVWVNAPADLHYIALVRHISSVLLIATITWLGIQAIRGVSEALIAQNPIDVADNLEARRIITQTRVISRLLISLVALIGFSTVLMSFPSVRQVGMSLLASAGVLGLVAGIAARPVLGNLIAGLQIALSQPIRIDDVVIVENEWGWIEEITGTYVVVRLWDERRLVVPLQWFVEHPFQNWTRSSAQITGTVFLWVDYRMPLQPLRDELQRICDEAGDWDGRVALLQVTDSNERAMQLRMLVTAADSPRCWDLRCLVREKLVAFIQANYAEYLPTVRADIIAPNQGFSEVLTK